MNEQIFISYRRNDTRWVVRSIYKHLIVAFPKEQVFMDIDTIEPGTNFLEIIQDRVRKCDVLIAVIGKHWLQIKDDRGNRMLDNSGDFVRLEIATALKRKIPVIPVLVDEVSMPSFDDLPEDLKALSFIQAIKINEIGFKAHIKFLIKKLKKILKAIPSKNDQTLLQKGKKPALQINSNTENRYKSPDIWDKVLTNWLMDHNWNIEIEGNPENIKYSTWIFHPNNKVSWFSKSDIKKNNSTSLFWLVQFRVLEIVDEEGLIKFTTKVLAQNSLYEGEVWYAVSEPRKFKMKISLEH